MKKLNTVDQIIGIVMDNANNCGYGNPFECVDEWLCDSLCDFDEIPAVPEKAILRKQIEENKAFKDFFETALDDMTDGIITSMKQELKYRKEQEEEEKEAAKEEARYEAERKKEEARYAKESAKETKAKQALAKTLNAQQKKALLDMGVSL